MRRLLERHPDIVLSVSATTRAPRPTERDGVDYVFVSDATFDRMVEEGELLEWAEVHGNWYGTPRDQVREALAAGRHAILKIDVQGAQRVKELVPDALLVFVIPPTLEDLFARLRARATEDADELELRQRNAAIELARQDDYDYVVVNETGQVDLTARRIHDIIAAEAATHPDRRIRV